MQSGTPLKPWHLVAVPRDDIRKGQPLDAAEFAIHLDQVVDGRAPPVYKDPNQFFARTYFTSTLFQLAVELTKRLDGHGTGTSPGVNLTTQFGGGKTHFLTLLYHMFSTGPSAKKWQGVSKIVEAAGVSSIPKARVAVLVGNRFDFVSGVGAGTEPRRKTLWGELAWQLGGPTLFELVRRHDEEGVVPGGEVVQKLLDGGPTLILLDEVLSLSRRARDAGGVYSTIASQLYSFLDVLTREIAAKPSAALVVSLPLSEYEMTAEDQAWFQRLEKILDRLSKPVFLAEKVEITEIVRRRLFEQVGDPSDIESTSKAYAEFLRRHHDAVSSEIGIETAEAAFSGAYPFHPSVLSVFERKWQSLPTFQQTRGILRLLALWLSETYQQSYRTNSSEPLLDLGSAPLETPLFRAAVFDQLGDIGLQTPVLTDIAGTGSHAELLDNGSVDTIRKSRLHQRTAIAVFFESAGGQLRNEATLPEIRFDIGRPAQEIANIETALANLVRDCYYLDAKGTGYWISKIATLNKVLADRRAILVGPSAEEAIKETCRSAVRRTFEGNGGVERRFFPDGPDAIPDTPSLRLVVLSPEFEATPDHRSSTEKFVQDVLATSGTAGRTFKSGLIFVVGEGAQPLVDGARNWMAVRDLLDPTEVSRLRLEGSQVEELRRKQLDSERELSQRVVRSYKHVAMLAEDGRISWLNMGVISPTPSRSVTSFIVDRLEQDGIVESTVSPDFLVRNWPPSQPRWNTKVVRDTFFASPRFPRLLDPESIRSTVAEGVRRGKFGYGSDPSDTGGSVVIGDPAFTDISVELSSQAFIVLPGEINPETSKLLGTPASSPPESGGAVVSRAIESPPQLDLSRGLGSEGTMPVNLQWDGELPIAKWSQFALKFLSQFHPDDRLVIRVHISSKTHKGLVTQRTQALRLALEELGLTAEIQVESGQ